MKDPGTIEGLDRLRDVHVAALNDGNAEAWADCFTAEAVQMPPNQPANVGSDEIRRWCRGSSAPSARSSRSTPRKSS